MEDITDKYKHFCFPTTLQRSYYGAKDRVYFECSQEKGEEAKLLLFTKHSTWDEKTEEYNESNLHWIKVKSCPFCGYRGEQIEN